MPGFTEKAYANPSYRKFLTNSIGYVAGHRETPAKQRQTSTCQSIPSWMDPACTVRA